MNYIGLNLCDTANGPGVRVSLFVSGCTVHCKDCFNKESWDFNSGNQFNADVKMKILSALNDPYIAGFSLLGGDPFEPEHEKQLKALLRVIKTTYPEKTIWAWTGRRYESVKDSPLMQYIDVLIDGAYVDKLKVKGKWYGSSNQRVIEIKHV